jgi:hypothetical protein
MPLGLGLVGHQLELDRITSSDLGEGVFDVCKGVAPVWTSIEIHKFNFGCPGPV